MGANMKEVYNKFLSSGFQQFNEGKSRYIVNQYRHNYLRYLPDDKSAKILEIGAGMGNFLQFLGENGYDNYLGVDVSEESINYCKEKGLEKVKLISDLKEFFITSATFDFIVMNDVIEHLPQDDTLAVLKKMYEKLNYGGTVIIKTGNLASIIGPRIRYGDFTHYQGFTEYSLSQVMKVSGFSEVDVKGFVVPKNRIRRILRAGGQKIVHGLWKLVYFLEFTYPPKIVDEIIFAIGKK